MQKLLLITALSLTLNSFATVHIEVPAKAASGGLYKNDGRTFRTEVKECLYTVMDDSYDEKNIRVFLNSDEAGKSHFGLTFKKSFLPLREGAKFSDVFGFSMSYKNGILLAERTKNDGLSTKDSDRLELVVSKDLMEIKSGHGLSKVGNIVRSKKFKELKCEF